eukprot:snap_masked-scaffold_28-processed-gene-4.10-mRNA-1 protein AED:1.00 eAED:1.00 QI:0/0/0/0/1/1/3/0/109
MWDEDMYKAYKEMMKAIEQSIKCSIGYYDPEQILYFLQMSAIIFIAEKMWIFLSELRVITLNSGSFSGSQLRWLISCKEWFPALMAIKKYPFYLIFNAKKKFFLLIIRT